MLLTFSNNQFELRRPDGSPVNYITDIKAAARFRRYADEVAERVFNRALVKRYSLPSTPLPPFLDPHQINGINWILTRSRSYLAHAPGAGKTCEAIVASLLAQGARQTLFIVPPSLTMNWEREILKWTEWCGVWPSIAIVPVSAKQQAMAWRADFIICPDSMLTKPWVIERLLKLKLKFLAVDEASRFKEWSAARSKTLFKKLIYKAKHTVLMDGSPMPNRPMELYLPVAAMSPASIDFMTQHEFGIRYCGAKYNDNGFVQAWEYKGASHEDELRTRIQKEFMHVVTEVALSHPERKRSMLFMNKDSRTPEMKLWEQKNLSRLKLKDIDEDLSRGDIATHRRLLGETKIEWVANYVRERLREKNESILLFAWHKSVCEGLANALEEFKPALITGDTFGSKRERHFRSFQNGTRKLIVGNIAAMGRGHNLQRADRVVFAEFSWTDETNIQAEKRASRKGSSKEFVRCDYVVVPNSIDEPVLNAVFTKAKNVKRIIG